MSIESDVSPVSEANRSVNAHGLLSINVFSLIINKLPRPFAATRREDDERFDPVEPRP